MSGSANGLIVVGVLAVCVVSYIPICWAYDLRAAQKRERQAGIETGRSAWMTGAKALGVLVLAGGLGAGWWYGFMADTVQDMQQSEARHQALQERAVAETAVAHKAAVEALARLREIQRRDAGGFVKAQQ